MRYAGAWRRRGMLATAVTFVLPGAMAAAVAVGLLSGAFGLGAAGQLLTGPEVPAAASATAPAHAARPDRLPTVPAAPRRVFAPAGIVASPAPAGTTAPATRPVGATPQRGPVSRAPSPIAAPAATPSSSPPAGPSPRNPLRDLGQAVADNAGALPAPVGPAGHDAITRIVELVPPPPAALGKALKQP